MLVAAELQTDLGYHSSSHAPALDEEAWDGNELVQHSRFDTVSGGKTEGAVHVLSCEWAVYLAEPTPFLRRACMGQEL